MRGWDSRGAAIVFAALSWGLIVDVRSSHGSGIWEDRTARHINRLFVLREIEGNVELSLDSMRSRSLIYMKLMFS